MRATLLLVAALGACAADPANTSLAITFDPCEPVALSTAPDVTDAQLRSIDEAMAMWAPLGPYALARSSEVSQQRIDIVFQDAAAQFHGLYDDERGIVFINRGLSDDHQRAVTIAHELGHAFGLFHIPSDERVSVMNPANLTVEPGAADAADLAALWGACPAAAP